MLHFPTCIYFPSRISTDHIGSMLFIVAATFLLPSYHNNIPKIILIWQTSNITYTGMLAVTQSMVKHHWVWHLGVNFRKKCKLWCNGKGYKINRLCWWRHLYKIHDDHYGPAINKQAFLSSTCYYNWGGVFWEKILESFERSHVFMDVNSCRDYVEWIYVQFWNQIQSEYYDSNSVFYR